ncbi:MFS transporter [Candidatus Bipolaricaulota bacterium]|nr:MFS transporter [Candidatus Bipolaricaulota bacterium]
MKRGALSLITRSVEPWYLALAVANAVMGTSSILIPLKLDRVLHLGPSQLGILSSIASAAAVLGSLVWGRFSDAAHRRKAFVVASYLMVGVAHVGLAFSTSFYGLVLHNTLLSFFWIANASVAVLLVIERSEEISWESHISALNLSGAMGWLLGLVLGGIGVSFALQAFSERLGMQTIFLTLAVFAFISAGLAAWLVPRTGARFTERRFRGVMIAVGNLLNEAGKFSPLHIYHRFSLRRFLTLRRETRLFLLASALAFTGIGFFGVPLAMLLSQRLGFAPSLVFYGYVMLHSGIVIAYPFALHRIRRRGNRRVLIGALSVRMLLFAVTASGLWLVPEIPWAVVAPFLFLIGLTWSFFQLSGVAFASRLAKPENRGLALGTYNAIAGGSTMVAGVCSGYLAQHFGHHMTLMAAVGLLLCSIVVLSRLPDPPLPDGNRGDTAASAA